MSSRLLLKLSAVLVATVVLSGCFWRQPGFGPANTRYNPYDRHVTPANVTGLREVWSVDFPGGAPSEVVSDGARLYMTNRFVSGGAAGVAVEARHPNDGRQLWTQTLVHPVLTLQASETAVSGDHLAVAYVNGQGDPNCGTAAYLDRATGQVVRSAPTGSPISSMVTSGAVVARAIRNSCGPSFTNVLIVEDRDTGATRWTAPIGNSGALALPLVVADGRVYVMDGTTLSAFALHGCGASTCQPLWTRTLNAWSSSLIGRATNGSLILTARTALRPPGPPGSADPGSFYSSVLAVDGATGNDLWQTDIHGQQPPGDPTEDVIIHRVVIAGDTLAVPTSLSSTTRGQYTERLLAVPSTGCGQQVCDPAWTAPLSSQGQFAAGAGDVLYVLGSGKLEAFDREGCDAAVCSPLKSLPVAGGAERLSVSGGQVYVVTYSSTSRTLHAFAAH